MTVAIKPLNLAELLAQNQELDINRARMAKAQRDEERQTRLSEALGRYKYGTPEYVEAVGAVDPGVATGVQNAMMMQQRNQFADSQAHISLVGKLASGAMQQLSQLPKDKWEQALPAIQDQIIQGATEADPEFAKHLMQNRNMLSLQNIEHRAMTFGGYKDHAQELQEKKREWEEKAKIDQQYGGESKPYFTNQYDDLGYMLKINARTGDSEYSLLNGKPFKGAKWDTGLLRETEQAKSAGRKEGEIQGTSAAKNAGYESAASSKQILDIIGMTPGKMDELINASTGSGVGAGIDALAGAVGVTTKGADALSSLRPIAAKLTGMQPRFEGPQSDADRKYYQEMAGDLANQYIPTQQRINALNAIRGLALKYSMQSDEGAAPAAAPTSSIPPGAMVQTSPSTGKRRFSTDGGKTWTIAQ
jgi:hypothetical protein